MAQGSSLRPANRSAAEIARELREDFIRDFHQRTGSSPAADPILGAVFHALANQVDRVYQEADQVFFQAVLDDLIRGLGMPARLARPAQAVVQFSQITKRESVSPETELVGYRPTGEQLGFAPDAVVDLAPTDLVFAGVFEGGRLNTLAGAKIPGGGNVPILPGLSTPLDWPGAAPIIFLAFSTDDQHLSRLGLYFDLPAQAQHLAATIARSPWQLLDDRGMVTEKAVLRSTRTRGGMWQLRFTTDRNTADVGGSPRAEIVPLVGGAQGSRIWLFPEIPKIAQGKSRIPPALATAVPKVLPEGHSGALDRMLTWVQIPLPAGTRGVANAIARIAPNCLTASNIDVWNDHVDFGRMGQVVSYRPMGNPSRHIMGVLSVTGESGTEYLDATDLEASPSAGRFRHRGGSQFEFAPAKHPSGRFDQYAMVRLLYCDGAEGNGVAAGEIKQIRSDLPKNPTARVTSLTPSQGGAAPPKYPEAKDRFAELLRTRERIVTSADIEIAVKAFEPLVKRTVVNSASEITEAGLGLVTTVQVHADPDEFADPMAEFERLAVELTQHLESRSMIGHRIIVTVKPDKAA